LAEKKIKAVLFDLGDTLLNYGKIDPHEPFIRAAKQTYHWLKEQGQNAGTLWLYTIKTLAAVRIRIALSNITHHDFDSLKVLKKVGEKMGHKLTDKQYEDLAWLWYEPLAQMVTVEPDIKQTLTSLKNQGLKMGIISNTFVSAFALDKHIRQFGLTEFFDLVYYSYTFKKRKPYPEMFLAAANELKLQPGEIAFVGDRIDTDIKGSIRAGMLPVLKKCHSNLNKKIPQGTIVINSIAELPGVIETINQKSNLKMQN